MPRSPVPRGLRAAVWDRDEGRCQRCARLLYDTAASLHHRRPRQAGGGTGTHTAENLLLLCGTGTTGCHAHVESHRTEGYELGYLVHRWDDPAAVPVHRYGRGWALCGPVWSDTGAPTPSHP